MLERGGGYSVDIQLVDGQTEGLDLHISCCALTLDRSTLATNGSTRLKRSSKRAGGLTTPNDPNHPNTVTRIAVTYKTPQHCFVK